MSCFLIFHCYDGDVVRRKKNVVLLPSASGHLLYKEPVMAKNKRYYQSKNDRMDESYGMSHGSHNSGDYYPMKNKKNKKMNGDYYGMREGSPSMLYEDRGKHAHMPTEVIMKQYPRQDYIMQDYGDTLYYTDMYSNETVRGANKQKARKKY